MRFIKTFILRLYIDPDVPDLLCGSLRHSSGRENFPFKNGAALIDLLHQLATTAADDKKSNPRSPIHESENID